MTKFEGTFSGHTTGGGGKAIGTAAAAVIIGALVFQSAKGAASTIGSTLVIAVTAVTAVVLSVTATLVVLRMRGHRRTGTVEARDGQALPPGIRWQHNPNALPPRERPAIAAPAPVTVINNFGGLASELAAEVAGLLYERQQQAAPIFIPAQSEPRQEIRP